MFKQKIIVTIIDTKWKIIKNRLVLNALPSANEYLYFDNLYHQVINIVHSVDEKHGIFVIINTATHQPTY